MTLPALSNSGVIIFLLLLATQEIWLIICLVIKIFDIALSIFLTKLPNERIGNLYFSGAIVINIVYALITLRNIITR